MCVLDSNGGAGAHLIKGDQNQFHYCDFEGNGGDVTKSQPYGLLQDGDAGILLAVKDCHFEGNGSNGSEINLVNAQSPRIINNSFYGAGACDYAVSMDAVLNSILEGNNVTSVNVACFNYTNGCENMTEINNLNNSYPAPAHAGTYHRLYEVVWDTGGSALILPGVDDIRYRININAGVITAVEYTG